MASTWSPRSPSSWAVINPDATIPATQQCLVAIQAQMRHTGSSNDYEPLKRLLAVVEKRGKILDGTRQTGEALVKIANLHEWWIRPVEDWVPTSKNVERQLHSLIQHLFATYPKEIRRFWLSAFMGRPGSDSEITRGHSTSGKLLSFFLHIAEGKNVRTYEPLPLEITLTKKMAHIFIAEDHAETILQQLRYAQLKSMGIAKRQIDAILSHGTSETSGRKEEEWKAVFYNIVTLNPMLDPERIPEMLDYLRFEATRHRMPNEKSFCMKGRTAEALLRQSAIWHQQAAKEKRVSGEKWGPSPYQPYRFQKTQENEDGSVTPIGDVWTIEEIITAKDLSNEGRTLNHCVGSYARSCISGHCSIWSLRMNGIRCLTIEVRTNGTIAQIRGQRNRRAHAFEATHIHRWAEINGFNIASYA